MDLQDVWVLPKTMKAFGICACAITSAAQLLVNPSEVTPAELMDLFRQLVEVYEPRSTKTISQLMSRVYVATRAHRTPSFFYVYCLSSPSFS